MPRTRSATDNRAGAFRRLEFPNLPRNKKQKTTYNCVRKARSEQRKTKNEPRAELNRADDRIPPNNARAGHMATSGSKVAPRSPCDLLLAGLRSPRCLRKSPSRHPPPPLSLSDFRRISPMPHRRFADDPIILPVFFPTDARRLQAPPPPAQTSRRPPHVSPK